MPGGTTAYVTRSDQASSTPVRSAAQWRSGWLIIAPLLLAQASAALGLVGSKPEPVAGPLGAHVLPVHELGPLSAAVTSLLAPQGSHSEDHGTSQEKFSHGEHVADLWWTNHKEAAQDCRGCHAFDIEAETGPSFIEVEQCYLCHLPGVAEIVQQEERQVRDESNESFRHHEHLGLECAKCHRPGDSGASEKRLRVPDVVDLKFCWDCHGGAFTWDALRAASPRERPTYERLKRTKAEMEDALNDGLRRRSRDGDGPAGGLSVSNRPFSHSTHLSPGKESNSQNCATCHQQAAANAGPASSTGMRIDLVSCAECHTGVRFEPNPGREARAAAFSFDHSAHAGTDCTVCHDLNRAADEFRRPAPGESTESIVGGEESWYRACVECHEGQGQAELPGPVDAHGEGNHRECAACHGSPGGARLDLIGWKDVRPTLTLDLPGGDEYGLPMAAHGGCGSDTGGPTCIECHKSPPGSTQPERTSVSFQHSDHLELTVGDEARCARCHGVPMGPESEDPQQREAGPLAGSTTALVEAEIREFLGQGRCSECHREIGAAAHATAPAPPPSPDSSRGSEPRSPGVEHGRTFARFSHAQEGHAAMACSTCHEWDPSSGSGLALTPQGSRCASCHDHRAENTLVHQGRVPGLKEAKSCVGCHAGGAPETAQPALAQPTRVEIDAREFVHRPNERECSKCHDEPKGRSLDLPAFVDSQSAPEGASSFRDERPSGFVLARGADENPHKGEFRRERIEVAKKVLSMPKIGSSKTPGFRGTKEGDGFFQWVMPPLEEGEEQPGERCLHCHWNSIDKPEKLTNQKLWSLRAGARGRLSRPLDATWTLGLAGVVSPYHER